MQCAALLSVLPCWCCAYQADALLCALLLLLLLLCAPLQPRCGQQQQCGLDSLCLHMHASIASQHAPHTCTLHSVPAARPQQCACQVPHPGQLRGRRLLAAALVLVGRAAHAAGPAAAAGCTGAAAPRGAAAQQGQQHGRGRGCTAQRCRLPGACGAQLWLLQSNTGVLTYTLPCCSLPCPALQLINTQEHYVLRRMQPSKPQQQVTSRMQQLQRSLRHALTRARGAPAAAGKRPSLDASNSSTAHASPGGDSAAASPARDGGRWSPFEAAAAAAVAAADAAEAEAGRDAAGSACAAATGADGRQRPQHVVVRFADDQQQLQDVGCGQHDAVRLSGSVSAPSTPRTTSLQAGAYAEAGASYVIRPRLTLVFRDVCVSSSSIRGGLRFWWRQGWQAVGCSGNRSNSGSDTSRHRSGSSKAAAGTTAQAAAVQLPGRARLIVNHVSGLFQHSQLHAIMGPSGSGKTTLCKALASRLPGYRVAGEVAVLCWPEAGQQQQQQGAAAALAGVAEEQSAAVELAAADVAHMTALVPQNDQLHESLTVSCAGVPRLLPCCKLLHAFSHVCMLHASTLSPLFAAECCCLLQPCCNLGADS